MSQVLDGVSVGSGRRSGPLPGARSLVRKPSDTRRAIQSDRGSCSARGVVGSAQGPLSSQSRSKLGWCGLLGMQGARTDAPVRRLQLYLDFGAHQHLRIE